ncbi:MAG: sugar transferase [Dysgonamonadaceae bacterium]|jgi:exopolysaccharide biosynthesis polyprenyl glycosylphosphotransferase|nr:sugar transferase [Dysgonamonadaceae bacterium]
MKRLFYIILDLLIVYGSILLSYFILSQLEMLASFEDNFEAFEITMPFIGIFYLILMYVFGLYNISRKTIPDLIYTVFLISIILTVGIMGIGFLVRGAAWAFPRSVIFLSAPFYFMFLSFWRILVVFIDREIHGVKKITIFGDRDSKLFEAIVNKHHNQYKIENRCTDCDASTDFETIIQPVDEIFMSADVPQKIRRKILSLSIRHKKEVFFVPEYFDLSIMGATFDKSDDIPTYHINYIELSPEEEFLKRVVDIVLSSVALIISFPFALIFALLVKLDGGPIIYSQERLTKGSKIFKILKFRTMVPDAEKLSGPVLAGEDDPRITKIGRLMRLTRMDEIPQLINVFKGEMSFVGPRPERPFFVEKFEREIPEYRYRLVVKAGLTGLAQVEGKYNTSVENKLRYDLIYVNNYSLWRDFLIILQTIKILFMKSSTEGINDSKSPKVPHQ